MDSSKRVSDVPNTCGRGEIDGCEERIRPFLDDTLECVSESIMSQKTRGARAGGELNKGKIRRCYYIPWDDRGVVYMRVLEKFGGFGGFVTTGLGIFEHVRRR